MLAQMVVQRGLELSHSSLLMMLAMLFSNSMVTIGKDALLRYVRIVLQTLVALVVVVASEAAVASEEASVVVVALAEEAVLVVGLVEEEDSAEVAVDMADPQVALMEVLEQFLLYQTPLLITLLLVRREARSSTSAT